MQVNLLPCLNRFNAGECNMHLYFLRDVLFSETRPSPSLQRSFSFVFHTISFDIVVLLFLYDLILKFFLDVILCNCQFFLYVLCSCQYISSTSHFAHSIHISQSNVQRLSVARWQYYSLIIWLPTSETTCMYPSMSCQREEGKLCNDATRKKT